MAGHSKWAQIKRQKGTEDARRARMFAKISRAIITESKRVGGDVSSPSLRAIIERAKTENMPKDTIERAVKRGLGGDSGGLTPVLYEAYGPGGSAFVIEGITNNKNRTTQEVKVVLSKYGASLANSGSALWAFRKEDGGWKPSATINLSENDGVAVGAIIEELENMDDIQAVYTNAD